MKTDNPILHFHTGRGGRYYNAGHTKFVGEQDITTVLRLADESGQHTFINPENYYEIIRKLENRDLTNLLDLLAECSDNEDFTKFEQKTGLELGEMAYFDCNGSMKITVSEAAEGTGWLNWDNEYDTDVCKYLNDCDESELKIVFESDYWDKDSLIRQWFDSNTKLKIDWDKFNGDYLELLDSHYYSNLDIQDFYTEETEA
jgi:hypothetical protein